MQMQEEEVSEVWTCKACHATEGVSEWGCDGLGRYCDECRITMLHDVIEMWKDRATKTEAEAFDLKAKLEGAQVLLREARKAFTLEDLEAQIARTQGRGHGHVLGTTLWGLFRSLGSEVAELGAALDMEGDGVSRREALGLELGDVINVAVAIAMHAGFTLREVVAANDAKMRARMPEGCGE